MYKGKEYYIDKTKKYMWEHQLTQKELARQMEISPNSLSLFLSGNSCSQEQRGYFYCRRLIDKIDNEQEMKTNLTRYGLYLKNHDINKIKFINGHINKQYNKNKPEINFDIDDFLLYGGNDKGIAEYFKNYNIDVDMRYFGHSSYSNPSDKQSFTIKFDSTTQEDIDRLKNDILIIE